MSAEKKSRKRDWTFDQVHECAKQFDCRGHFFQQANAAYFMAYRGGYLDEVCKHMTPRRTNHTLESVLETVDACASAAEFRKKHRGAYQWAAREGHLKILKEYYRG